MEDDVRLRRDRWCRQFRQVTAEAVHGEAGALRLGRRLQVEQREAGHRLAAQRALVREPLRELAPEEPGAAEDRYVHACSSPPGAEKRSASRRARSNLRPLWRMTDRSSE